ncbi:hypothetical protein SAMN05216338_104564 [Bradyrhizobium sp. Rc2d]|nr:hypothetical protein SAMN05216338_104564 [Bradyrhizobium sp. Rc2d]
MLGSLVDLIYSSRTGSASLRSTGIGPTDSLVIKCNGRDFFSRWQELRLDLADDRASVREHRRGLKCTHNCEADHRHGLAFAMSVQCND